MSAALDHDDLCDMLSDDIRRMVCTSASIALQDSRYGHLGAEDQCGSVMAGIATGLMCVMLACTGRENHAAITKAICDAAPLCMDMAPEIDRELLH